MPQTSPERAARWPGGDSEAIKYLEDAEYSLTRDWCWIKPTLEHEPTEREIDAILYLCEEWDYGGVRVAKPNEPRLRITKVG